MEKPLAADKKFLREGLLDGVNQSLELNVRNADLLGLDQIKIFEIGNIFTEERGEFTSLCIAVENIKKGLPKEGKVLKEAFDALASIFDWSEHPNIQNISDNVGIQEVPLNDFFGSLPEPLEYEVFSKEAQTPVYKQVSMYPFSVRDIAVFTPSGTEESSIREIIEKESGALLVKNRLFDVFTKGDKTSYAFRMVFQSFEKTLTEEEINDIMNRITTAMNSNEGWQVR